MWVWVSSSFVLNGCESGCKIPPMGMAGRLSEMKQVRSGSATLPMGAQRVTEYKDRLHNQATSSRVPHIWPSPIQTLRLSGMPSSATLTISAPSLIAVPQHQNHHEQCMALFTSNVAARLPSATWLRSTPILPVHCR
jgi:hypothetical protein